MLQMSCEEHDKIAAKCQFITHTIGRYICCLLHYITCGLSINHAQTHIVIYMFNRYNFGLLFYQDIGRNGYQVHTYWYKRLSFTCSIGIYLQSFCFQTFPVPPPKPFLSFFGLQLGMVSMWFFTTCCRRTPPSEIVLTCTVDYSYIIGLLYKRYGTAIQMAISQNIVSITVYLY